MPTWASSNYDKIVELGAYIYHFYYLTSEQARLAVGAILKQFRSNILTKKGNESVHTKLFLYSGHDTYVAGLVKLLNLTEYIVQPPYTSAVVLELRRSIEDTSKYFVQCLYKNNTIYDENIEFKSFKIGNCSDYLCPLEEFLSFTKNLIVEDFKSECKISKLFRKLKNKT